MKWGKFKAEIIKEGGETLDLTIALNAQDIKRLAVHEVDKQKTIVLTSDGKNFVVKKSINRLLAWLSNE